MATSVRRYGLPMQVAERRKPVANIGGSLVHRLLQQVLNVLRTRGASADNVIEDGLEPSGLRLVRELKLIAADACVLVDVFKAVQIWAQSKLGDFVEDVAVCGNRDGRRSNRRRGFGGS